MRLGLDGAIDDAIDAAPTATTLPVTTDLRRPSDRSTIAERTVVLRIAQEALQNVRKHAGASIGHGQHRR